MQAATATSSIDNAHGPHTDGLRFCQPMTAKYLSARHVISIIGYLCPLLRE